MRVSDIRDWKSVATFVVSLMAFVVVCEHLLPALIVRRDPERVLDVTLPVFAVMAKVDPAVDRRAVLRHARRRAVSASSRRAERRHGSRGAGAARGRLRTDEEGDISEAEGRELLQSIVDFTETVVREVMTPRPDIIAIRQDASLADLRALFREEQYSADSRLPARALDNIVGVVFVKDLVALPPGPSRRSRR